MKPTRLLMAALCALAGGIARAAPTDVTITPPPGARFLQGQKFDLRVEGKGTGPYAATLSLDGRPLAFTSGDQNTTTTDGITTAGWGGFDLRGFSLRAPGPHTLTATFTDATGTVQVTSRFEIVDLGWNDRFGWGHEREGRRIKNVIFFLGDGMGIAHRTAARIVGQGVTAGNPNGWLNMDRMPGYGAVTTHSLNSIITDSAPGMACYTTGNHAANNQEGVFPAHVTNPFFAPRVEYLAAFLHRTRGTSTGIVTTADLEDATPAANAVYTANRGAGTGIVDQYLDESSASGLAVLLGGGRRWFLPSTDPLSSRSASTDSPALPGDLAGTWGATVPAAVDPGRDLVAGFRGAGFTYVQRASELASAGASDKLLGLFAYGNMNVALDKLSARRGVSSAVVDDAHAPDQPMLDEMTRAALSVLSRNRRGFFLMVEGAHIDKQSHAMDAERAIGEVLEFDKAIGVGLDYAARNDQTLVVVTADHECAGFSVIGGLTGGVAAAQALPSDAAALDPTVQPARQKLVGTYDAAGFPVYPKAADGYPVTYDVDGKVLVGFGASGDRFENWLTADRPIIESLTPTALKTELAGKGYVEPPADRASKAGGFFLRGQAVGHTSAVHTAADVPISVYAQDPRVWREFAGVQRNVDVFFKIADVMGY
jgi:alkaline phosphatase